MCMLTYLPADVHPNTDRLQNGTVSNRDGHGWAIVVLGDDGKGSHILTGYSMNADAAIEAFRLTRIAHPEGPALFHSRMTTGGLIDESNCHPYVVNSDPRTVLAHNGILPDMDMPVKDERSDTRFFSDEFGWLLYPGAGKGMTTHRGEPLLNFNLNAKRGRRRLSTWLGKRNKFVILTVDPAFRRNAFLINGDQGVWENDGCWYSNTGYLDKPYTYGLRNGKFVGGGWSSWEDDYQPTSGVKKWWEDAEGKYDKGTSTDVWTRLANLTEESTLFDKQPRLIDPESECDICGARGFIHTLNWCTVCGCCLDCFGDALDDYSSDRPCTCAWPMGEHPGHQKAVSEAFSRDSVDADPADATEVVTTLGPPPVQRAPLALPVGSTVREPEGGLTGE